MYYSHDIETVDRPQVTKVAGHASSFHSSRFVSVLMPLLRRRAPSSQSTSYTEYAAILYSTCEEAHAVTNPVYVVYNVYG